ncbi:hypothetical protein O206_07100 [Ochrobactrum sp. EGD-AQ16]|nr:hypothetical protein O206_07100 [Ochrobactrum sp. EGD-AQ16]
MFPKFLRTALLLLPMQTPLPENAYKLPYFTQVIRLSRNLLTKIME